MNILQNIDANFKSHPLYHLLCDCIKSAANGSGSEQLWAAFKVKGWSHEFVRWDGAYSVEQLSWETDDVFDQLVKIYS